MEKSSATSPLLTNYYFIYMATVFDTNFGQQLCDSISNELGYICNFMGSNGIIVASSVHERIGNVHPIAAQIMTGVLKEKEVTAEEAARSTSMKEGVNIGIDVNGERVASFSIAGPLDKVSKLAHVLGNFVTLVMREQISDKTRMTEAASQVSEARKVVNIAIGASQNGNSTLGDLVVGMSRISQFIEQIKSTAEMTSLLAVTATIEGATAGEIGKSFALVANEVKTLSTQTAGAADEIARHIHQAYAAAGNVKEAFLTLSGSIGLLNQAVTDVANIMSSDVSLGVGKTTLATFDPVFGQELCDMVAKDLGYVCSFMGQRGVIVASSARERIGSIHAIASRIMACEMDERAVTAEEASTSQGMREGYSVGIDFQGVRIINFGIGGPLEEVTTLARVISTFVTSVLKFRYMDIERNLRTSRQVEIIAKVATSATKQSESATATVHILVDSISHIRTIVDQIRVIAEQINMVAWNASFNAFRAGASGKGFAVVANEIKTLSKDAAKATQGIAKQTNVVETHTENASLAVSSLSQAISQINSIITCTARLTATGASEAKH